MLEGRLPFHSLVPTTGPDQYRLLIKYQFKYNKMYNVKSLIKIFNVNDFQKTIIK